MTPGAGGNCNLNLTSSFKNPMKSAGPKIGRWYVIGIECGDPGLYNFTCVLDTYSTSFVEMIFNEQSGIADFIRIIRDMKEFEFTEFFVDDIVRSDLVKSYIIARDKLGL
jgi:hypothetical protein